MYYYYYCTNNVYLWRTVTTRVDQPLYIYNHHHITVMRLSMPSSVTVVRFNSTMYTYNGCGDVLFKRYTETRATKYVQYCIVLVWWLLGCMFIGYERWWYYLLCVHGAGIVVLKDWFYTLDDTKIFVGSTLYDPLK